MESIIVLMVLGSVCGSASSALQCCDENGFWFNDAIGSTHFLPWIECRLQLIGKKILVWNGDTLIFTVSGLGIWELRDCLLERSVPKILLHLNHTEAMESYDEWNPDPNEVVNGKDLFIEAALEKNMELVRSYNN